MEEKQYSYRSGGYRNLSVEIPNLKERGAITVKACSKEGGSLQKSFDVPKPESESSS